MRSPSGPEREDAMLETLQRHAATFRGYTELRWQANQGGSIAMRKGTVLANARSYSAGVSARRWRDGVFGFASRPGDDAAALARVLADAHDHVARHGRKAAAPIGRALPSTAPGTGRYDYRTTRPTVSRAERLDLVRRVDAHIAARYPGLTNFDVALVTGAVEKALVTSEGAATYSYMPRANLMVSLSLQANDSLVELYDIAGGFGDYEDQFGAVEPVLAMVDAIYDQLRRKAEGAYCEAGLHDVILDPVVTGILAHEAIGHTCEADAVMTGSVAGDHLGEPVAAEKVTLIDGAGRGIDGQAATAIHVDDEGTPCRDVAIIERGVLKEFLHSKETALRLGLEPTGNARANAFSDEPLVRMRNTAIAPGEDSVEDMIAAIDRGYYLKRATNGQADSTSEFTFGIACGYEIRNGKLGRAIRDTTISGVAFDMLKTVTHVGRELKWAAGGMCGKKQWIPVGIGGPAIKCQITVGGK
jgi:TldD protein